MAELLIAIMAHMWFSFPDISAPHESGLCHVETFSRLEEGQPDRYGILGRTR